MKLRDAASLYNAALEERIGAWKLCRKSINYYDQANQLKAMRADGCLSLANFSCCQDVLRRLDKTFQAFFGRVKRGEKKVGYPRFRSSRRYDSITFPSYGDGCRLLDTGKLRIQGASHIRVHLHRPLEGVIKTVTIKREAGRWLACFSAEREAKPLPASVESVGIDVGLASFAVLSNGEAIANPRHYRNAEAGLRRCQRKVARRKRGSNRRRKAVSAAPAGPRPRAESAGGFCPQGIPQDHQPVRRDRRGGFECEGPRRRNAGEVGSRRRMVDVPVFSALQGCKRRQSDETGGSARHLANMRLRSARGQDPRGPVALLRSVRFVGWPRSC